MRNFLSSRLGMLFLSSLVFLAGYSTVQRVFADSQHLGLDAEGGRNEPLTVADGRKSQEGHASDLPTFDQFKVKVSKAKPKPLRLRNNKWARMFRTRLRQANKNGVNFAGHFIVAEWGCGTSCLMGAIIDIRTGKIHLPDQLFNSYGIPMGYPEDKLLGEYRDVISFKKDSRLLIMSGYADDNTGGKYGVSYYEWTGSRLKLVKFIPVELEDKDY